MMGRFIDLTGKKFGKLTVIERRKDNARNGEAVWKCECFCANKTIVYLSGSHLRCGHKKHCGCILNPKTQEYVNQIKERLLKSQRFNGQCIEWTGFTHNGYGYLSISANGKSRPIPAPRANWLLNVGPIPKGYEVCHKCDNPLCIRLDHLFLGTHAQNMKDCKMKKRHCHGEKHPNAKLTEKEAQEILDLKKSGICYHKLAKKYGIKPCTIKSIWDKANWKHLEERK